MAPVVMDKGERDAYTLLQQVFTLRNAKDAKARVAADKHKAERAATVAADTEARRLANRGARKRKFAELGQREAREAEKSAAGGLRLGVSR